VLVGFSFFFFNLIRKLKLHKIKIILFSQNEDLTKMIENKIGWVWGKVLQK
jgi:hypothetical protein